MAAKKIMRHASALKAHRKSLVHQQQNTQMRSAVRTLTNKVLKAVSEKKIDEAKAQFQVAQAAWHKAAKNGIFHDKAVSRKISRLASRVQSLAKS